MDHQRFEQQLAFILESDKEKNILRQTHLTGHGRRENDAEHAWHMAMMIYLLKEYANEEIDVGRAMMMALIHDIVEIDAGDTYAYDTEGLKTQKEREERAADRIFGLLPEDQRAELRGLFEEFESYATPEARFARAMDNFQPLLLNHSNGGEDWVEHQVTEGQVRKRQSRTQLGSQEIWNYTDRILKEHVADGSIRTEAADREAGADMAAADREAGAGMAAADREAGADMAAADRKAAADHAKTDIS